MMMMMMVVVVHVLLFRSWFCWPESVWCDGNLNNWIINLLLHCRPLICSTANAPIEYTAEIEVSSIKNVRIKRISGVTTAGPNNSATGQ